MGTELCREGGWYSSLWGIDEAQIHIKVRQKTVPRREMQGFSHPLYLDMA